jgi:tyrosine-protein phosphatase non-receptor type 9
LLNTQPTTKSCRNRPQTQINHYHYTAWPDHGVPASTTAVRRLCHSLDDCRRAGCRVAVHCSAGVGRTGAFVAIDMLLQRLHRLRVRPPGAVAAGEVVAAVDVRAAVLALRRQRRGMVQTAAQYEMVYRVLLDELRAGVDDARMMAALDAPPEARGQH